MIFHGSMNYLHHETNWQRSQESNQTQSPLSAALEQARMNMKTMGNEMTVVDAYETLANLSELCNIFFKEFL